MLWSPHLNQFDLPLEHQYCSCIDRSLSREAWAFVTLAVFPCLFVKIFLCMLYLFGMLEFLFDSKNETNLYLYKYLQIQNYPFQELFLFLLLLKSKDSRNQFFSENQLPDYFKGLFKTSTLISISILWIVNNSLNIYVSSFICINVWIPPHCYRIQLWKSISALIPC